MLAALLVLASVLEAGAADTVYTASGTIDADPGDQVSFGAGAVVEITFTVPDAAVVQTGEGARFVDGEMAELDIAGAPQVVEAVVLSNLDTTDQFNLFVQFQGAANPDIDIAWDLQDGAASFPHLDFALGDPGAILVAAQINEDGVLPDPITVTGLSAMPVPEPAGLPARAAALVVLATLAAARGASIGTGRGDRLARLRRRRE